MPIKRLDDIEREKAEEKREKFKRQITEDARDVIEGVFAPPKKTKNEKLFIRIGFCKPISRQSLNINRL